MHAFPFSNIEGRYIRSLHSYLLSFVKRTQPLVDIDSQQLEAEAEFNRIWEAREMTEWEESSGSKVQANGNGLSGVWCSACR